MDKEQKVLVFKNCFDCMAGDGNYCTIDSEIYLSDKNICPKDCPLRKRDFVLTLKKDI